jgi:phospholipid/cholesterol/gamma-HCH transport system substrate-binding protein
MVVRRAFAVGVGVAVVLVALLAAAVVVQKNVTKPAHRLTLSFPTASGLVPGSDVFEAGAKVGTIADIVPTKDDRAVVTVEIGDNYWPLHQGVQADIRPKSLLGEKYVDIHDGPPSNPPYDARRTLVASSDSVPVELDQFINSLDASTRDAARVLLNDLGAGIAGRGVDLNQAIQTGRANLEHLAVTGQTLNNRDPDLDRILVGLDGVLQKLTQDDQLNQLSQLISNGQQTLDAIEAEQQAWSRTFTDAQVTLAELNTAFSGVVPNLRDLLDTAPVLLGHLQTEADILARLGQHVTADDVLQVLATGVTHGPTASGGALEVYPDGRKLPIFRVCLTLPAQPNNSCAGNLYPQPGSQPVPPQPAAANGAGAGSLDALSALIGA